MKLWPVFRHINSSAAEIFGYPIFGGDPPRWVSSLYRPLQRINDIHWELRWRFWPRDRYNIVRTGLEPGYYDQDTRMLNACFALLGDWIEEEGGIDKIRQWSHDLRNQEDPTHNCPEQADKQDEAIALWQWWTLERPADKKRRDAMMMELFGPKYRAKHVPVPGTNLVEWVPPERSPEWEAEHTIFRDLEKKIDDDEQAMLHRLVDIRPGLWT